LIHQEFLVVGNSVTARDVAQGADVSVATVSRVLNNQAHVKEDVRQRVLKAAADLGYLGAYTTNGADNRTINKALKEIGFIYSSSIDDHAATSNPFWSRILHGAEREAYKSNIKITYRSVSELTNSPQLLLTAIKEMRLGGILLVGPADAEIIKAVAATNVPLVLVDNYVPKSSVEAVLSDNFEGARQAVEYLIEKGHRHIAFIGGPTIAGKRPINKIYTIERRAGGYRTALLDAGLPVPYYMYESGNLAPEGGYQACKRLLANRAKFDAIFCANDETAIGAMKALREAGLKVPEDVSVVGFDDIDMAEHYNPSLTTVRINKEAMGAAAVRALIARVADPEAVSQTIMLDVDLIERASVASR